MAVKQKLEVVPSLPAQPDQDLEAILAPRLADELMSKIDIAKLARLIFAHMGQGLQQRLINWLVADNSAHIALNEMDAIAIGSSEVES